MTATESPIFEFLSSRYQVISQLGSGGWSTVYRARQLALGQTVAVKILHQHLSFDTKMLKRFEQEAQTASALSHPNIVSIIDYGATPQPYIVMEYVEGHSLSEEIEKHKRLPPQTTIEIGLAICAALAAAHSQNIIHRDIKPSNVVVAEVPGKPLGIKVLDFGLSKLLEADESTAGITRTGEALGSPPYMSPEQWSGKGVDARSDIYALGCLLYESLTGIRPFSGQNAMECMQKHLTTMPEAIISLHPELQESEALDRIIFKAISKEVSERYQTVQEMQEDLEQVKLGRKLRHADSRHHTLVEWLNWRKKLLLGISAAVVILGAVLLAVAYYKREEIISNIWSFNFKAGQQAAAEKDYKTAELRFETAITVLDLTNSIDKRLYWTLKCLLPILNSEKKIHEQSEVDKRIFEFERGSRHCNDLLESAAKAYQTGKYENTRTLSLAAIEEARKSSPENLAIAMGLNDMGVSLLRLSRPKEAERACAESLRIRIDWLGKDDPYVADSASDLAEAYFWQGQYAKAKSMYLDVLRIQKKTLSPDSSQLGNTYNSLGVVFYRLGEFSKSESCYQKCIKIWEKSASFDDTPLCEVLCNLADLYMSQRKYALSEAQLRKGLSLVDKWYGPNHPFAAGLYAGYADLCFRQKKLDDAITYQKKSLEIRTLKLGANDPLTLRTRALYESLLRQKNTNQPKVKS